MPYTITRETRGVYKQFRGSLTSQAFFQSVTDNHSRPDYETERYAINDFSGVDEVWVDMKDIVLAIAHGRGAAATNPDVLVAVVTSDAQIRELSEKFGRQAHYTLGIFDTVECARKWIDQQLESRQSCRGALPT